MLCYLKTWKVCVKNGIPQILGDQNFLEGYTIMKKTTLFSMLMALALCLLMTACSGGGGGAESAPAADSAPESQLRHRVTIYPGQEAVVVPVWGTDHQIVNLVLNGDGTQAIYAANAVKVYFNYQCGWHVAGGEALEAPYGATTFIEGIPTSAQFLISITDKDGREYTLNPDFTDVFLSDGTKINFDKAAGVYKYGDQSDVALSCK